MVYKLQLPPLSLGPIFLWNPCIYIIIKFYFILFNFYKLAYDCIKFHTEFHWYAEQTTVPLLFLYPGTVITSRAGLFCLAPALFYIFKLPLKIKLYLFHIKYITLYKLITVSKDIVFQIYNCFQHNIYNFLWMHLYHFSKTNLDLWSFNSHIFKVD